MKVFQFTGICAVVMGTILTILMVIARQFLIQAFIDDQEVISYGIQMVIALQMSGPVIGILFLCINTIQGMGKAFPSLVLTICRQGLIFIPSVFILNKIFGLEGVIYAQLFADYLSIILSIFLCFGLFKKIEYQETAANS